MDIFKSNAKATYHAVGNEVFDRHGHHIISISYAPFNDRPAMARRIARLFNLEEELVERRKFNQQGVDNQENRNGTLRV